MICKSGCRKSRLLYILSTMDKEFTGDLKIDGIRMLNKKEGELAMVCNEKIGSVVQFTYFLHKFNVRNNVVLRGLKLAK